MPELPEVESVRRSLNRQLPERTTLESIKLFRKDLRFPIPRRGLEELVGATFVKIERRGKYLLFFFSEGILISHLGMTGQWRFSQGTPELQKHDHLQLLFSGNGCLTYNDPRRFGYVQVVRNQVELEKHPLFEHLGVEPLSAAFSAEFLQPLAKGSKRAVKIFIMDQEVVVGVGNIYASEVLFRARIKPQKAAGRLRAHEWQAVVDAVKSVLNEAIAKGGSTIRDYRTPEGESGGFQSLHQVYDREGEACFVCGTPIKSQMMGGRATYWCPKCQR